jgi:hypothetical protein
MKRLALILLLLPGFFLRPDASAQQHWQERIFMEYYVETPGDTVYVDTLPAAVVFPRIRNTKDPDVKKYYKLVYNFNKVYPYTDVAVKIVRDADRDLAAMRRRRDREKYVDAVSDQLLDDFSSVARHMTVSQGKLLVRLVDREVGKTPYTIVKEYKSGVAASFWQGVAKVFGQDLKTHYDPKGEDRMTEYLIEKWNEGQFDALYFSIFREWPETVVIPSKYM